MNDSEPTPQPEENSHSSACHKAANIGVIIIVIQAVLMLLLRSVIRPHGESAAVWFVYAIGILNTVLFLACTVCGVIALAGIARHGMRQLLWKGLLCLLPAAGFVAALVLAGR